MEILNIIFYCPSKKVGGNEYLFVRLVNYYSSQNCPYNIYYIDYHDGFSHSILKSNNVHYIDYKKGRKIKIPDNSAVVLQLNMISQLEVFEYNRVSIVFLFWCLHPNNIRNQINTRGTFFLSKKERMKLGDSIRFLSSTGSIKFMMQRTCDKVIRDLDSNLNLRIDPLPNVVPVDNFPQPNIVNHTTKQWIFCWLGRLDKELSQNLLSYMNDIELLVGDFSISLYVVGTGPEEDYIRNRIAGYSYQITFLGEKKNEELNDIIEEINIGLAVGTSAFEFAMRGKPTIMNWSQDKEYKQGERLDYCFTYESELPHEELRLVEQSFKEKFLLLSINYVTISKECYDFVLNKRPAICGEKLINSIISVKDLDWSLMYSHIDYASNIINRARKRISFLSKLKQLFCK